MIEQWLQDYIDYYERLIAGSGKKLESGTITKWERIELNMAIAKDTGRIDAYSNVLAYLRQHGYAVVPKEMVEKLYA